MDREYELKHFEDIENELKEEKAALEEFFEKEKNAVKGLKAYINEHYEAMDVKELRENVQDAGNMVLISEADGKKIHDLEFLIKSPYFGKFKFIPEGKTEAREIYIGTSGYWSEKESLPKIYDWRTPIASLYYDYITGKVSYQVEDTEGPRPVWNTYSGEITEKAQFKIKDSELLLMADTDERVADDLLLATLSGNAPEKMRPVVATIQKKQNEIIRETKANCLVVDGRAGSGKTVIAMHRLAWLLYQKRKYWNAGNVMVLSPNTIFSDYVSEIMPELGEEAVLQKNWDDLTQEMNMLERDVESKEEWAQKVLTLPQDDPRVANIWLKQSTQYFDAFNSYIEDVFLKNIEFKDFKYEKTVTTKEELEKWFFRSFSSLPAYERLYNIAYFIVDRALEANKKEYAESHINKLQNQVRNLLVDRFAEKNLVALYEDFLKYVAIAYPGAEEYINPEGKICYEDFQALFYLQIKLYGCKVYKDLKHLIIDEMQDYSVFQFAIIKEIFGGSKTILGDQYQVLLPNPYENVLDVILKLFPDRKLLSLNKTYRSTEEITNYCNKIISEELEAESVSRHGEEPVEIIYKLKTEKLKAIKETLKKYDEFGCESVAILCDDSESAAELYKDLDGKVRLLNENSASYQGGNVVLSRFLAKGMEFDGVIVVTKSDDDEFSANPTERNAFYISCTRALHHLTVIKK